MWFGVSTWQVLERDRGSAIGVDLMWFTGCAFHVVTTLSRELLLVTLRTIAVVWTIACSVYLVFPAHDGRRQIVLSQSLYLAALMPAL